MLDILKDFEDKMNKTVDVVISDFASVRAGRANAAVLDKIQVDYYGTPTPIQQVAGISSPDPRSLMITPWDKTMLKAIEKAILASELGITPQNDGQVIRLAFPQLTEDDRKLGEKDLQDLTDKICKKLDDLCEKKEKALMAV